jgi:WD40 repeat protein
VWKEYPSENREIITDVTFSSDSKYFVYCGDGGVARYVNLQSLKKEGFLDPPSGSKSLYTLTFNNKNQLFLGGIINFIGLTIWDFNKDKEMVGYYPDMGVYGTLLTTRILPYLMMHAGYYFELLDLDSIVSVPEAQQDINDLLVSPNPASDYIEINLERWSPSSGWTPSEIKIYNSLGQCVLLDVPHFESVAHLYRIDISGLSLGMYYAVLRVGKDILTNSFIVLR